MVARGSCDSLAPRCNHADPGVNTVHNYPLSRTRMSRIAWSMLRHPMKRRDFPAKHERLITPAELLRYGY